MKSWERNSRKIQWSRGFFGNFFERSDVEFFLKCYEVSAAAFELCMSGKNILGNRRWRRKIRKKEKQKRRRLKKKIYGYGRLVAAVLAVQKIFVGEIFIFSVADMRPG